MTPLTKWMKHKLLQEPDVKQVHKLPDRLGVKIKPAVKAAQEKRCAEIAFDSKVHGQVESDELGKNVLVSDEEAREHTRTQALLRILSETSHDVDTSSGVDPYNAGFSLKE